MATSFVEQGIHIKADVFRALMLEHELVLEKDFVADFIEQGLRIITMVSHAQMLEVCKGQLVAEQLTVSSITTALEELEKRVDLACEKFGKQVELLHEVDLSPEERH